MNKTTLVLEALVTVRPVLAWKRAFKRPPAVPSATLRPVIELSPGWHSYQTPAQIDIACQAWFANRAEAEERYQASLASTVPAKAPLDIQAMEDAYLDLGDPFSPF